MQQLSAWSHRLLGVLYLQRRSELANAINGADSSQVPEKLFRTAFAQHLGLGVLPSSPKLEFHLSRQTLPVTLPILLILQRLPWLTFTDLACYLQVCVSLIAPVNSSFIGHTYAVFWVSHTAASKPSGWSEPSAWRDRPTNSSGVGSRDRG